MHITKPHHHHSLPAAVGTLMCQLGAAAMYLGALVVRYPTDEPQNLSEAEREDIRGDIMILMYIRESHPPQHILQLEDGLLQGTFY